MGLAEGLGFRPGFGSGFGLGLGLGVCLGLGLGLKLGARTLLGRWARPEVALGVDQPSACGSDDGNGVVRSGCGGLLGQVRCGGGRHRGIVETASALARRLK